MQFWLKHLPFLYFITLTGANTMITVGHRGASGHVPVNSCDENSRKTTIQRSIDAMEDGSSFMIYPEGTRSKDSYTLASFKTGAFRLSQKSKVDILPLILKGTGVGMPIGGICRPANLEIIIGNPLMVGPKQEDIQRSIDKSKTFMQQHLSVGINNEIDIGKKKK